MEVFLFKAIQLIAALSLLVLIHEFGHYVFARMFGIRVDKFYLFFNPGFSLLRYNPATGKVELFAWDDKEEKPHALLTIKAGRDLTATPGAKIPGWRQTVYGIGWLPLGGYCKISGMVDESMDTEQLKSDPQPWEFRAKPAWQRLLVMIGGVLFNFLLAIVIYIGLTFSYGEKCIKFRDAYAGMDFVPAALDAGFRPGDIPLQADGEDVEADMPDAMMRLAEARKVTVLRNGSDTVVIDLPKDFVLDLNDDKGFFAYRLPVVVAATVGGEPAAKAGLKPGDHITAVGDSLTPSYSELVPALRAYAEKPVNIVIERDGKRLNVTATPTADGTLGFQLTPPAEIYPVFTKNYTLLQSIPKGWELGVTNLSNYASSMRLVFTQRGAKSIGGFGALGSLFPERWSWYSFWTLTAFLSVALAFMNIIPIPALDGGHVLFLLWEVITRRQVPEKFLEYAQMAGMAFLLLILVYANGMDIIRFFAK